MEELCLARSTIKGLTDPSPHWSVTGGGECWCGAQLVGDSCQKSTWHGQAMLLWTGYLSLFTILTSPFPMLTNVWSTDPMENKAINEIKTVKATEKQKEWHLTSDTWAVRTLRFFFTKFSWLTFQTARKKGVNKVVSLSLVSGVDRRGGDKKSCQQPLEWLECVNERLDGGESHCKAHSRWEICTGGLGNWTPTPSSQQKCSSCSHRETRQNGQRPRVSGTHALGTPICPPVILSSHPGWYSSPCGCSSCCSGFCFSQTTCKPLSSLNLL